MKITFLGTGTSQGIPIIGCNCNTCLSKDSKDKRLRSSIMISFNDYNILIDVGPDFRQQMLAHKFQNLNAILLTHEHNDHIIGLDDIRPFNFKQGSEMPVYGLSRVLDEVKNKFAYIFEAYPYPGAPRIKCYEIIGSQMYNLTEGKHFFTINVMHGSLPILGFRFENFAYITDASFLDEEAIASLSGLDVLVINALQFRKHYSHFTFEEAIEYATRIKAKKTYLTHMSHELGKHIELLEKCPHNIIPAHDGLLLEI